MRANCEIFFVAIKKYKKCFIRMAYRIEREETSKRQYRSFDK